LRGFSIFHKLMLASGRGNAARPSAGHHHAKAMQLRLGGSHGPRTKPKVLQEGIGVRWLFRHEILLVIRIFWAVPFPWDGVSTMVFDRFASDLRRRAV
jgi:hypothetical protein